MSRKFGHAPAPAVSPVEAPNPGTSEGLTRISRTQGVHAALAASAQHAMKTGRKQVATLITTNGAPYVRLGVDEKGKEIRPRDPRTMKQQDADEWVLKYGINAPMPKP